jgi:hypothetical protein
MCRVFVYMRAYIMQVDFLDWGEGDAVLVL